MNAGHFIPKSVSLVLRWNEQNVNGQCVRCNLAEQGNQLAYSRGLAKKYGPEVVEKLEMTRHGVMKLDRGLLEILIKKYKG
jgi:5-methylcytosine-specific restriction endonuclease McrA